MSGEDRAEVIRVLREYLPSESDYPTALLHTIAGDVLSAASEARRQADTDDSEAALGEPTREAWGELRLTGQPPGARPFDVTVRSDTHDTNGETRWTQLENVARLALGLRKGHAWTDVAVRRRYVETTRRESPWTEVSVDELAEEATTP